MWDKVSMDEGVHREKELVNTPEFWGWMLSKGSRCHRHDNPNASAANIVGRLANHKAPITTDLQRQLVDENKPLDETAAGRELQSEILREKAKWAKEVREIEEQMEEAIRKKDRDAEEMMREERDRYTKMIRKVENDTGALKSNMENLLAERDNRVATVERQLKEQNDAHEAALKQLNKRIEKEKTEVEKERRRLGKEEGRRKQKEQEKQKEEKVGRDRQKKEQEQARLTQIQAPKPTSSLPTFPPYSLTIANSRYMSIGPKWIKR